MDSKSNINGYVRGSKREANGIENARPVRNPNRLWSIILAGGNGERISADIHRWMGPSIPKQYCAFVGTRSMLLHTLARVDALGPREHQPTVVARSHQGEVMPALNFSADLLRPATSQVAVMPMEGILWSDWGRTERIVETLCRVGRQPNFPMILAGHSRLPAEDSGQNDCRLTSL